MRDLSLVMTALDLSWQARRDPAVLLLAGKDPSQISLRGLRIGWFSDDGFMAPCPAIVRAVERAKAHLQKQPVPTSWIFGPCRPRNRSICGWQWISSDAATTLQNSFLRVKRSVSSFSRRQSRQTARCARATGRAAACGQRRRAAGETFALAWRKPVEELWRSTAQRTQMRRSELDAWNEANIDAVICPPHVLPAMRSVHLGDLTLTLSYMFRYVMLNFVAESCRSRASPKTKPLGKARCLAMALPSAALKWSAALDCPSACRSSPVPIAKMSHFSGNGRHRSGGSSRSKLPKPHRPRVIAWAWLCYKPRPCAESYDATQTKVDAALAAAENVTPKT